MGYKFGRATSQGTSSPRAALGPTAPPGGGGAPPLGFPTASSPRAARRSFDVPNSAAALAAMGTVGSCLLEDVDQLALLLAALCHDLGACFRTAIVLRPCYDALMLVAAAARRTPGHHQRVPDQQRLGACAPVQRPIRVGCAA